LISLTWEAPGLSYETVRRDAQSIRWASRDGTVSHLVVGRLPCSLLQRFSGGPSRPA